MVRSLLNAEKDLAVFTAKEARRHAPRFAIFLILRPVPFSGIGIVESFADVARNPLEEKRVQLFIAPRFDLLFSPSAGAFDEVAERLLALFSVFMYRIGERLAGLRILPRALTMQTRGRSSSVS